MRRISLDPNHLEGKPLSDKDSLRLEELAKQIQDKMRRMRTYGISIRVPVD